MRKEKIQRGVERNRENYMCLVKVMDIYQINYGMGRSCFCVVINNWLSYIRGVLDQ